MSLLRLVRNKTGSLTATLAVACLAAACLTACGAPAGQSQVPADGHIQVVASFYPLQWVTQTVAGPDTQVDSLTPPGTEPHDAELSPAQVSRLQRASLVVTLSGFQAAVDQALSQTKPAHLVDAATVVDMIPGDPHFWLDPQRLEQIAMAVAAELELIDPAGAAGYQARANALARQLDELDQDFQTTLAPHQGASFVTTHDAFSYLATRYGLNQVSITGLDPEEEPSPARLASLRQEIKSLAVRLIYFESAASPKIAEAVATSLNLTTAVLNPIEIEPERGDYLTAQRDNLRALTKGFEPLDSGQAEAEGC